MRRADWTDEFLDAMRQQGDPVADAAVRAIFAAGELNAVNQLLGKLLSGQIPVSEAPEPVASFLDGTATLPAWMNQSKRLIAEELAVDYGFLSAGLLYTSGLPTCYSSRSIAFVLSTTLRLEREELMWRRLIETGQFVFNVSNTNGMTPGGVGVRSTQQVRLMHAAIRHLILTPPSAAPRAVAASAIGQTLIAMEWDPSLGSPVNQEELAWTLLTFSYCVVRGLEQLGGVLTDAKKDAYIHLWSVVGHVLGIDHRLLPADFAEAEALFERLAPRVSRDTPMGRDLVNALVNFIAPVVPRSLVRALIRYHVGDARAEMIGVRASGLGLLMQTFAVATVRFIVERVTFLYRESYVIEWLGELVTRRIVGRIVSLSRAHGRGPFQLPEHLAVKMATKARTSP